MCDRAMLELAAAKAQLWVSQLQTELRTDRQTVLSSAVQLSASCSTA